MMHYAFFVAREKTIVNPLSQPEEQFIKKCDI